jgi:hypothetical protein
MEFCGRMTKPANECVASFQCTGRPAPRVSPSPSSSSDSPGVILSGVEQAGAHLSCTGWTSRTWASRITGSLVRSATKRNRGIRTLTRKGRGHARPRPDLSQSGVHGDAVSDGMAWPDGALRGRQRSRGDVWRWDRFMAGRVGRRRGSEADVAVPAGVLEEVVRRRTVALAPDWAWLGTRVSDDACCSFGPLNGLSNKSWLQSCWF